MNRATRFHLITAFVWLSAQLWAQAQGTAFTYQGSLSDHGEKANGIYRLRLTMHSAETGSSVVAGPITNSPLAVVNGLFTTVLDFGAGVFDGNRRWLELGVATNGGENFVTLSPRQEILPSPYAIAAARLIGPLPSNGLAGAYSEQVTLSNPGNVFAGDGTGLTNIQAATLGGLSHAELWQLGGNSGTSSNSFLGTTEDEPLELKVYGQRALRLEPQNGTINVIAGFSGNTATRDGVQSHGVTISGGGRDGAPNTVDPLNPRSSFSTIGGGSGNSIAAMSHGTISGGHSNSLRGSFRGETCGTIGGGMSNHCSDWFGTIGGGEGNSLDRATFHNTIGGGYYNRASGAGGTIGGGARNSIDGPAISPNSDYSTIGGGVWNLVGQGAQGTTIAGGRGNQVLGGDFRKPRNLFGTIGGGESNTVDSSYGTIPGGREGKVRSFGQMAYAAGEFSSVGDAQTSVYVCRGSTTNATPTELFLDGASEQIKMPTNSVWTFDILVVAATPDGTSASYQILGAARNKNGITTLAAAPKQNILVEDDPSWNAVPFAAAADNKLAIRVTGSAATSVRWVATIRTTEVIY